MFIIEYLSALIDANVPAELGAEVFTLLVIIVKKEDQIGRNRPVGFWNPQLQRLLGVSDRTFRRSRQRAIKAGWLRYLKPENGSRKPCLYYVTIPDKDRQSTPGKNAVGEQTTYCKNDRRPTANLTTDPRQICSTFIPSTNSSLVNSSPSDASQGDAGREVALAKWMFGKIQELNPGHREPDFTKWAKDIRLMREKDNRTEEQIQEVFEWAFQDEFWVGKVQSPRTLRRLFDQLQTRKAASKRGNTLKIGPGQRYDPNHKAVMDW